MTIRSVIWVSHLVEFVFDIVVMPDPRVNYYHCSCHRCDFVFFQSRMTFLVHKKKNYFNNAVISTVLNIPVISIHPRHLGTILRAPTTISISITFMFRSFSAPWPDPSIYLPIILFSFIFTKMTKFYLWQVLFSS